MLWGNAGVKALFDRALSAASDFALAHITRTRLLPGAGAHSCGSKVALTPAQAFASEVMPREAHPIMSSGWGHDGAGPA